jgi:hypothetical protein
MIRKQDFQVNEKSKSVATDPKHSNWLPYARKRPRAEDHIRSSQVQTINGEQPGSWSARIILLEQVIGGK